MLIKIKSIYALDNYLLITVFDDNKIVEYDMKEDIKTLPNYSDLESINGLWEQAQLDKSRTCVFWNDYIDLPCDTIYEYGKEIRNAVTEKIEDEYDLECYEKAIKEYNENPKTYSFKEVLHELDSDEI